MLVLNFWYSRSHSLDNFVEIWLYFIFRICVYSLEVPMAEIWTCDDQWTRNSNFSCAILYMFSFEKVQTNKTNKQVRTHLKTLYHRLAHRIINHSRCLIYHNSVRKQCNKKGSWWFFRVKDDFWWPSQSACTSKLCKHLEQKSSARLYIRDKWMPPMICLR